LRVLAEEQAALRRVATLVAQGVAPQEVFAAVTEEVVRVLRVELVRMGRYGPDDTVTFVAGSGMTEVFFPTGARVKLGGENVSTRVARSGASARIDTYTDASGAIGATLREHGVPAAVGTPIIVGGRLWGVMAASPRPGQQLPADAESRLAQFTELLAMAVANAESRAGLQQLAAEQAALRRVATLVAEGVPADDLFAAVAEEVGRLLGVEYTHLGRYESDETFTFVAVSSSSGPLLPVGSRLALGGKNLATTVLKTGLPARLDGFADATGPIGAAAQQMGVRSAVAAPIIVAGRLWGLVSVGSIEQSLPEDTEARLAQFTELLATAIANAESRADVAASRARIVAAADETRRRIERDLHDGAQQRLVHTVIVQQLALRALHNGDPNLGELMAEALRHAEAANAELSELAHGILPSVLTREGLRAGVQALVTRMSLPVRVDVCGERLAAGVEATAYFVVSEALTNVVKHAKAASAEVTAGVRSGVLRVAIRDDGVGGAHARDSSGLRGLQDRVAAQDGQLFMESAPGEGTLVRALLPLLDKG
jgi:signal transduction histidine kinase